MKSSIFVRLQIPGVHRWPECDINAVQYLKHLHRHVFHIEAHCPVSHDDRDVEFLFLQKEIRGFLMQTYWHEFMSLMFLDTMSCEQLAIKILEEFPSLSKVSVSEDGENGAIVCRE